MTLTQPSPEPHSLLFKALKNVTLSSVLAGLWRATDIPKSSFCLHLCNVLGHLCVPGRADTSGVTPKGSLEERGAAHRDFTAGEGGRRWGGFNPMVT